MTKEKITMKVFYKTNKPDRMRQPVKLFISVLGLGIQYPNQQAIVPWSYIDDVIISPQVWT